MCVCVCVARNDGFIISSSSTLFCHRRWCVCARASFCPLFFGLDGGARERVKFWSSFMLGSQGWDNVLTKYTRRVAALGIEYQIGALLRQLMPRYVQCNVTFFNFKWLLIIDPLQSTRYTPHWLTFRTFTHRLVLQGATTTSCFESTRCSKRNLLSI